MSSQVRFPYAHLVPRDMKANLAWRIAVLTMCDTVPGMRENIRAMCAADPIFFIGLLGWTHDTRLSVKVIPFIPWEFQVDAIAEIIEAIETGEDLRLLKSRDMGASWILLMVLVWYWLFHEDAAFLIVSAKGDLVDRRNDSKSLFWKIDFFIERLPGFMVPAMSRTEMVLVNHDNGASITGEATTGDVARSGRYLAIVLDEFAAVPASEGFPALDATLSATNCRLFNSTIRGILNAFDSILDREDMREVRMHWSVHPEKRIGLYRWPEDGPLEKLDATYEYDDTYKYIRDGKVRSPWYDAECSRAGNRFTVARELDMDRVASSNSFFDKSMIDRVIAECGRAPMLRGELIYDEKTLEPSGFKVDPKGRIQLWRMPDSAGAMTDIRRAAIGADVSQGTGASNSSLAAGDCDTGEKILELTDPWIQPEEFGRYAVAIAKWLNNAMICWESPGPGRGFGTAVVNSGYRRIWYKRDEQVMLGRKNPIPIAKQATSLVPGWSPNNKDDREQTYREYREALASGDLVNHSVPALKECLEIVYDDEGWVIHGKYAVNKDPSGARKNHGDRVTADALMWKNMGRRTRGEVHKPKIVEGSFAYRRRERKRAEREKANSEW